LKKIAAIFNTNQLGGAERSFAIQLSMIKEDFLISCYIPKISKKPDSSIYNFLLELGFTDIRHFDMPKNFYRLSRDARIYSYIFFFLSFFEIFYHLPKYSSFKRYDTIYANGNKAGFFFYLIGTILFFKNKIIWHFRDYPVKRRIWKIFLLPGRFDLMFVGNSKSVLNEMKKMLPKKYPKTYIYNPSRVDLKNDLNFPVPQKIERIGIVSMMAPWKGVHQIIIFAHLFEKELLDLGIKEIAIFGANIYKTKGGHHHYENQCNKLLEKFPSILISFKGRKEPDEIFKHIHLLLHTSIRPEPFGRVITEAFSYGIPVISTALGGAAELIIDKETGLTFFAHDYKGLLNSIKTLISSEMFVRKLVKNSTSHLINIEVDIKKRLLRILTESRLVEGLRNEPTVSKRQEGPKSKGPNS